MKERRSLCPGTTRVEEWKGHSFSASGVGLLWFSTNLPFLPVEFDMVLFTFPWPSLGQQDFSPAQNSLTLCEVRCEPGLWTAVINPCLHGAGGISSPRWSDSSRFYGTRQSHVGQTISSSLLSVSDSQGVHCSRAWTHLLLFRGLKPPPHSGIAR